jgi:sulfotransferase
MKKYYFMSGLPRSGSTLLGALFNQHPQVHCGAISPVLEIMYTVEQHLLSSEQYNAYPKPDCAKKMISSVIDNFYSDIDKPYVVDKCRAWPNNVERITGYITEDVKIVCTVRSIQDILASFVSLIRRNPNEVSYIDKWLLERNIPVNDQTRCDYLMSSEGIVDQSLYALSQGFAKGRHAQIMLVEYEDLVSNTQAVMDKIYKWYDIPSHRHDLENIVNKYREDDSVYDLKDMHEVRTKISKTAKPADQVLSADILQKYQGLDFWRKQSVVKNFLL